MKKRLLPLPIDALIGLLLALLACAAAGLFEQK